MQQKEQVRIKEQKEQYLRQIRRKLEGRELLSTGQDSANRKSYESRQRAEER
jgi:hypothetical protein